MIQQNKNRWIHSIFTRLICALLLIILPIHGLSIALFVINRNELRTQFYQHTTDRMNDFFIGFEHEIIHTHNMLTYLIVDNDLITLSHVPDFSMTFDDVQSIRRLRDQLNSLVMFSTYIESISIYIPAIGKKLNSIGQTVSFARIDYLDIVEHVVHQQENAYFTLVQNNLYMHIVSGATSLGDGLPLFIIEARIDMSRVYRHMAMENILPDSYFYFVLPDSSFILSNTDLDQVDETDLVNMFYPGMSEEDLLAALSLTDADFFISMYSSVLNAHYLHFTPADTVYSNINQFEWIYLFLIIISTVVAVVFSMYTYRLIKKPIRALTKAFHSVQNEDFDIRINYEGVDEFVFLFESFNYTMEHIQHLISEVYTQKILNSQMELQQLQAQINPHFLYNSFYILRARIRKKDIEGSEKFCDMLGTYFQYITKNHSDMTLLADEVRHARIYAEIQGERFRNRVIVQFADLPMESDTLAVPKLILQPVIENAFKYGLEEQARNGILRITYTSLDPGIVIHVEDNGSALNETKIEMLQSFVYDDTRDYSGLSNIHKRLKLAMGMGSGLYFSRSELGGLKVSIKIVLKGKDGENVSYLNSR